MASPYRRGASRLYLAVLPATPTAGNDSVASLAVRPRRRHITRWNRHIEALPPRRAVHVTRARGRCPPRFDDVDVLIRAATEADRVILPGGFVRRGRCCLPARPAAAEERQPTGWSLRSPATGTLLRSIESRLPASAARRERTERTVASLLAETRMRQPCELAELRRDVDKLRTELVTDRARARTCCRPRPRWRRPS